MLTEVLKRLQSPVVLFALLAQLVLLVGLFMPQLTDQVKTVGTIVIEMLTIVGILNNPSNPNAF